MTPSASAKRWRAFRRDGQGSAAVEFALVAPILLTLILGMLMLGIAYYQGMSVQWSLERSLRTAMIDPEVSAQEIEDRMLEELGDIPVDTLVFDYNIEDSGDVPLAVATVDYDVPLQIPFIPAVSLHFTAESAMPAPEES